MKITNEEIEGARFALAALKAYRHPRSLRGIGQELALRIRVLQRKLVEAARDFADERNALVERFGVLKDEKVPGSFHVPPDSANWHTFQKEARELAETEVGLSDRLKIKLSELRVRDEKDNWEKMECGEIADLGEILDDEGAFTLEGD